MSNNCCPNCVRTDQERRLFCGNPDCICHKTQEGEEELEDIELVDPEKREGMYCEPCGRCHTGPCQKAYPREKNRHTGWEKFCKEMKKQGYYFNPMWNELTELLSEVNSDFHQGRDIEKLKNVIRNLLSKQRQELIKKLRLKINNWISTNEKGEEYLSPEDLRKLINDIKVLEEK